MPFTVQDILNLEVAPALGCTEPVAIALGTAAAAAIIGDDPIEMVEIWVDPNIYKNGIAVAIPGTEGLTGLDMAGALGAIVRAPHLKLQVLDPLNDEMVALAKTLISEGKTKVNLLKEKQGLYIRAVVKNGAHQAEAIIENAHDNIVSLKRDGEPFAETKKRSETEDKSRSTTLPELEKWLRGLKLKQLFELIDNLDDKDLGFIRQGVTYNMRLAKYGLKHGSGLGIGKTLDRLARQRLIKRDMILAARILTSSASDARMAGVKMPAMSSAGSGNHGLTAILPIWAVKGYLDCLDEDVLKAIALSHIITAYVKSYTGRLSAVCGCSVAAGAGATAGIAYLLGGTITHIAGAIKNLTEDLAGVICDGAKAGCSLKLATAAGTAVQAALFALQGVQVKPTDGIIGQSPEKTMQNIGELSTQGMIETDRTILKIMLEKRFSDVN